jgi:hypothetical protein
MTGRIIKKLKPAKEVRQGYTIDVLIKQKTGAKSKKTKKEVKSKKE